MTSYQLPQKMPDRRISARAQSPTPALPAGKPREEAGIAELLQILKRHKGVILGTMLLVTAGSIAFALGTKPLFMAQSEILLNIRKANIIDTEKDKIIPDIPIASQAASTALRSEVELIQSGGMINQVIDRLDLTRDPEFNPMIKNDETASDWTVWLDPGTVFNAIKMPESWNEWLQEHSGIGKANPAAGIPGVDRERLQVIGAVAERLSVVNDGRSFVLRIGFKSRHPIKAAKIANAVADEYLQSQIQFKKDVLTQAQGYLKDTMEKLRTDVEKSDRAMEKMRETNKVVPLNNNPDKGGNITAQQLAELSSQLTLARASRSQAEARLRSAQGFRRTGGSFDGSGSAEITQSPVLQRLKDQEGELRRREAELVSRLGPLHPKLIDTRAELKAVQKKIGDETDALIQGLQNDLNVAQARERSLDSAMKELETKTQQASRTETDVRQLDREANTNRVLLDSMLTRYRQTTEQLGIQEPDARLISKAQAPIMPISLGKKQIVAAGLGIGALLGLIIALIREHMARGFRTSDEAEKGLGQPVIATIPRLGARRQPHDYVLEKPFSAYGESIRGLFAAIRLIGNLQPGRVVAVTSALPGEGKSTLTLSLARVLSGAGLRVMVIEGDLRRPSLSRSLGSSSAGQGTLGDYLSGRRPLEEVIQTDEKSGVHCILAGHRKTEPNDVFDPRRVNALFNQVAPRYDVVLVDTPPVLVIAESVMLSELADVVVFVTQWSKTPRKIAAKALDYLRSCGVNVVGTVLSQMDVKGQHDYADVYRSARRYYVK